MKRQTPQQVRDWRARSGGLSRRSQIKRKPRPPRSAGPSPAQIHREEVFASHGAVCWWAADHEGPEGHRDGQECGGRLQSCHFIAVKRLQGIYAQAMIERDQGKPARAVLAVSFEELVADDRNGVPGCELDHVRNEGPVLHADPPACFWDFVGEFELDHVVDNARSAK